MMRFPKRMGRIKEGRKRKKELNLKSKKRRRKPKRYSMPKREETEQWTRESRSGLLRTQQLTRSVHHALDMIVVRSVGGVVMAEVEGEISADGVTISRTFLSSATFLKKARKFWYRLPRNP